MTKKLRRLLLAGLMTGFLGMPALAAEELDQSEAFMKAGQAALLEDEWYLALLLWEDISPDSPLYPAVQQQFNQLKQKFSNQGASFDDRISGKALDKAYVEARQEHWVAAVYYANKVHPESSYAKRARVLREEWADEIKDRGTTYKMEFARYERAYLDALELWEDDDFYASLRSLRRIRPESPFYLRAQAILHYVRGHYANLPSDLQQDDQTPTETFYRNRKFSIGLQGRMGMPLGYAPSAGGGLGLSWYPIQEAAIHLEANVLPINGGVVGFIPLTARYLHPINQSWDLFAGGGGFMTVATNGNAFGLLAEAGAIWQFDPSWALELNADYGFPLSGGDTQTLGARLGIQMTF